jgi:hypothetical protein
MDSVFMQTVLNTWMDKVINKEPSYDKEVLQREWEHVNKSLITLLSNQLPELPKKNVYVTCTYEYIKGAKAGTACGKVVKNPGQERCYLHNPEKLEKKKVAAKKTVEAKKKTANQTVVADNQIVTGDEPKLSEEFITDSDDDTKTNDDKTRDEDNDDKSE